MYVYEVGAEWHAGYGWWSKDDVISDILLWTPIYGHTSVGQPTKTYIHQLCTNTWCSLEDLPGAMDDLMMMMIIIVISKTNISFIQQLISGYTYTHTLSLWSLFFNMPHITSKFYLKHSLVKSDRLILIKLRFDTKLEVCIYHIYRPLRTGRIWHKVNF